MYTYKRTEFSPYELYTVGTYDSGKWESESDHDTEELAARRVNFLNGGKDDTPYLRIKALEESLAAILGHIENGYLVRDTSKDHEPDWAMKQLPFLNDLGKATKLLTRS